MRRVLQCVFFFAAWSSTFCEQVNDEDLITTTTAPINDNSVAVPAYTFVSKLSAEEQEKVDKRLDEALLLSDVEEVMAALEAGANPEATDGEANSFTPLIQMALKGKAGIAELLLQHRANIEARVIGKTALQFAVGRNRLAVAKLLLSQGADPNVMAENTLMTTSPLHDAAEHNYTEMAELLLDSGADIDVKDKHGNTPLITAVSKQSAETATLLCQRRANVESHQEWGMTPLHFAALKDHKEMALILLENGANVQSLEVNGRTPLHDAAEINSLDVAELLLWNKADTQEVDRRGWTPLHLAAQGNNLAMAKLLIQSDAQVGVEDKMSKTPVDLAEEAKHTEMVKLLKAATSDDTPHTEL